jgi:predicted RNase H-like nuclease
MLAGVDGCPAGWVAAVEDGRGVRVEVFATFGQVLALKCRPTVVDIPIGLVSQGPRHADEAARMLLGRRACCVFSAPYRAMLGAGSRAQASSLRQAIEGKGCTAQAFGILGKIAQVDALMDAEKQQRIHEGHPEVIFAFMRGGAPFTERKRTPAGHAARLAQLRRHFADIETHAALRLRGVDRDDILDAFALLWTARRIAAGTARRFRRRSSATTKVCAPRSGRDA